VAVEELAVGAVADGAGEDLDEALGLVDAGHGDLADGEDAGAFDDGG
jgi:hypothetical protein